MGWNIKGQFFETCSCDYLCPCIYTNLEAKPTETKCDFALTFRIDEGEKDGVDLSGLAFIVLMRSPGVMAEGGFTGGLIVDEKASDEQTDAIAAIASGEVGGPMAGLAPMVAEIKGIEKRPIEFKQDGINFSVKAGELVDQACQGVASLVDETDVLYVDQTAHPANQRLALAKAVHSKFDGFGVQWEDSSGTRNGHFAPFSWSG